MNSCSATTYYLLLSAQAALIPFKERGQNCLIKCTGSYRRLTCNLLTVWSWFQRKRAAYGFDRRSPQFLQPGQARFISDRFVVDRRAAVKKPFTVAPFLHGELKPASPCTLKFRTPSQMTYQLSHWCLVQFNFLSFNNNCYTGVRPVGRPSSRT